MKTLENGRRMKRRRTAKQMQMVGRQEMENVSLEDQPLRDEILMVEVEKA